MPSVYTPDATNAAQPADSDFAYIVAAEIRTLKSYLASQLAASAGAPNRNKIINGQFNIWQYATTSSVNGYLCDDLWNNLHTGSSKTVSRQAFTLGQTAVPGEPAYYSSNVVTSVAGAGNFVRKEQRIEGVRTLAGQTATISFYAKADAIKSIAVEVVQNFGTGGSPSTQVDGSVNAALVTKKALSTSWALYTVTLAIPSIAGKTLGTNNDDYLALVFWFDAGSSFNARSATLGQQSGTFDLASVQFEPGTLATAFEKRPDEVELALCQRQFEPIYTYVGGSAQKAIVSAQNVTAGTYNATYNFAVTKRAVPTFTVGSGTMTGSPTAVCSKGHCSFVSLSEFYLTVGTGATPGAYFSAFL